MWSVLIIQFFSICSYNSNKELFIQLKIAFSTIMILRIQQLLKTCAITNKSFVVLLSCRSHRHQYVIVHLCVCVSATRFVIDFSILSFSGTRVFSLVDKRHKERGTVTCNKIQRNSLYSYSSHFIWWIIFWSTVIFFNQQIYSAFVGHCLRRRLSKCRILRGSHFTFTTATHVRQ